MAIFKTSNIETTGVTIQGTAVISGNSNNSLLTISGANNSILSITDTISNTLFSVSTTDGTTNFSVTTGGTRIHSFLFDRNNSSGTTNQVLTVSNSGVTWATHSGSVILTGGTYAAGTATFTNNTGGTFNVTGFTTGSTINTYVTLSSGTATSVATLDINISDWYSDYKQLKFVLSGVRPVTSGAYLNIRLSSDGTTYVSSASTYGWASYFNRAGNNGVGLGSDAATEITTTGVGTGVSNTSTKILNGEVILFDTGVSTYHPTLAFTTNYFNNANQLCWVSGSGSRLNAQVVRGIRFYFNTGNIDTLKWVLVGLPN